jgi:hypothetical protein
MSMTKRLSSELELCYGRHGIAGRHPDAMQCMAVLSQKQSRRGYQGPPLKSAMHGQGVLRSTAQVRYENHEARMCVAQNGSRLNFMQIQKVHNTAGKDKHTLATRRFSLPIGCPTHSGCFKKAFNTEALTSKRKTSAHMGDSVWASETTIWGLENYLALNYPK